jgi:hypothetical protein
MHLSALLTFIIAAHLSLLSKAFLPHSDKSIMAPRELVSHKSASSSSADSDGMLTILGFGSLLSERSSRMTFPDLVNFRLGRVPNFRRVFGHPTSIFFQRGIANAETKEMSSLSAEPVEGYSGFICTVFEVPNKDMMEDGLPSQAFLEREEEFSIIEVPYMNLKEESGTTETVKKGILCVASTDEEYFKRWGSERFDDHFRKYGIEQIWGWSGDSGLKPCPVYMRHCYLAAQKMGDECFNSFLDDTYLVDRETTLRGYLEKYPEVLDCSPPPELVERYSG